MRAPSKVPGSGDSGGATAFARKNLTIEVTGSQMGKLGLGAWGHSPSVAPTASAAIAS
jgi:hypothetical protein